MGHREGGNAAVIAVILIGGLFLLVVGGGALLLVGGLFLARPSAMQVSEVEIRETTDESVSVSSSSTTAEAFFGNANPLIILDGQGNISMDGEPYTIDELREQLQQVHQDAGYLSAQLQMDPNCPAAVSDEVISICEGLTGSLPELVPAGDPSADQPPVAEPE